MTKTNKLIIIAGRRRFRAVKVLGWKTVRVLIPFQDITKTELLTITLIENLHRKDLTDVEKGFGIVAVYEAAGYTGEQAIYGAKAIDNYYGKNPDAKNMDVKNTVLHMQENIKSRPMQQKTSL